MVPPSARGQASLRLRMRGKEANVGLEIEAVAAALAAPVPDALLDPRGHCDLRLLLQIRRSRAAGRESTTWARTGGGDSTCVPVRVPELWKSDKTQSTLTSIRLLSDDDYSFEFATLLGGPAFSEYLFGPDKATSGGVDEVVLFSGGLTPGRRNPGGRDRGEAHRVGHPSAE